MSDVMTYQEKHNERVIEAKRIMDTANEQNREMDADESAKFDLLMDEAEKFAADVKREQRLVLQRAEMSELVTVIGDKPGIEEQKARFSLKDRNEALITKVYAGGQGEGYTFELPDNLEGQVSKFALTAAGTSGSSLADLTDEMLSNDLLAAMQAYSAIFQTRARVVRTVTGGPWEQMVKNNTSRKAVIVAEGGATTEGDPTYDSVAVPVHTYRAATIANREAVQDASIDLAADTIANLSEAFMRGFEEHAASGDGSSKPFGVASGAHDVVSKAIASIDAGDFIDVEDALDPAYRANAEWMIGTKLLSQLKKLSLEDRVGTQAAPRSAPGFPLWVPSLVPGAPSTIMGYPYTLQPEWTATSANSVLGVLGDFSHYIIRIAAGVTILPVDQLYARNNRLAWYGFMRMGGRPVRPGDNVAANGNRSVNNALNPFKMITAA